MKVFCDFHARSNFENSLNATVIALRLLTPRIFHPISLVGGIY
jgi:hypothetical protein